MANTATAAAVAPVTDITSERIAAKRRRTQVPQLMGVAEVGDALGVRVQNLQFIKDLPQPVAKVRATRLWLAEEIWAFAEVYNERRRSPRE